MENKFVSRAIVFANYLTITWLLISSSKVEKVIGTGPAKARGSTTAKDSVKLVIDAPLDNILYKCAGYSLSYTVTTPECHANLCSCLYDGEAGTYRSRVCAKPDGISGPNIKLTLYCKHAPWKDLVNEMKVTIPANSGYFGQSNKVGIYGLHHDEACDPHLQEALSNGRQVKMVNLEPCSVFLQGVRQTTAAPPPVLTNVSEGSPAHMIAPTTMGNSNTTVTNADDPVAVVDKSYGVDTQTSGFLNALSVVGVVGVFVVVYWVFLCLG